MQQAAGWLVSAGSVLSRRPSPLLTAPDGPPAWLAAYKAETREKARKKTEAATASKKRKAGGGGGGDDAAAAAGEQQHQQTEAMDDS